MSKKKCSNCDYIVKCKAEGEVVFICESEDGRMKASDHRKNCLKHKAKKYERKTKNEN